MTVVANVKKQAIQIAKQMAEEVLQEPKRILETAGAQTGVIPPKSQEQRQQANQNIQIAKDNDAAFTGRRIREIEGELAKIRQEREQEEREKGMIEFQSKEFGQQEKPKKSFSSILGGRKERGGPPQRVKKHSGTSEMRLQE